MGNIVKCIICGNEFIKNKPNQKYCGRACKEAGANIMRIRWELNNEDYNANYMRKYREAKKRKK